MQNIKQWKWTGNNIGDEVAVKMSESLMTNITLTELNICCGDKRYNDILR